MTAPLASLPVAPAAVLAELPWDVVELAACPLPAPTPLPGALAEVAFRGDAWLPDEVAELRRLFAADEAMDAIAAALGRTGSAVCTKVYELGLRRNSARPWSGLEDEELARRYGVDATSAIAGDLGRTSAAVYARAGILGLTEGSPPPYTEWEILQIRTGYGLGVPVAQLSVLIGRPASGVASVASKLGIRHANGPQDWSAEEQARALALAEEGRRYREISTALAAEGYPQREHGAVGQVLRKLGYGRGWGRPWTPEEKALLRKAYEDGASLTPLRDRLGRTTCSIRWQAKEMELQGTHARPNGWRTDPPWSEEDLATLRRDYGKVKTPELARRLGRKKAGVYSKAWSLRLVHGYSRPFDGDEDRAIALARDHGISLSELATALDRDPAVVSKHAIRLGVPFARRTTKALRTPRALRQRWTLDAILALEATPAASPTAPTPAQESGQGRPASQTLSPTDSTSGTVRVLLPRRELPGAAPDWLLLGMEQAGLLRPLGRAGSVVLLGSV